MNEEKLKELFGRRAALIEELNAQQKRMLSLLCEVLPTGSVSLKNVDIYIEKRIEVDGKARISISWQGDEPLTPAELAQELPGVLLGICSQIRNQNGRLKRVIEEFPTVFTELQQEIIKQNELIKKIIEVLSVIYEKK